MPNFDFYPKRKRGERKGREMTGREGGEKKRKGRLPDNYFNFVDYNS